LALAAPPAATPSPTLPLENARRAGNALTLACDLDALVRLRDWIVTRVELAALDGQQLALVETALYEVCANVIEHGYGEDRSGDVEVGWLPDTPGVRASGQAAGTFVVRDDAAPFVPGPNHVDFTDPNVRRRGRGIGLPIVHGAMARVDYYPRTTLGNITLLKLEPALRAEEVSHG
jgi:anti-sigma regulatory factor (Ser/Thr protein kinase)